MTGPASPLSKNSTNLWPGTPLLVGALFLWLLKFEYAWATGDQDEFIPLVLHLVNPPILETDWFVGTQTAGVGVRTYFALLLRVLCEVIPPWLAVALVFVAAWLAIASTVHALTRIAGGSKLAAGLAVIVALVLTPKWTLGGNDLVYHMLVPEMLAWAIGLGALLAFCRSRYVITGALLGLASWFQILAGLHLLAMTGITTLLLPDRRNATDIAALILSFAVVSLPATIPIGLQQVESMNGGGFASTTYILAQFRAPYHFLPTAFPPTAYLKFGLLTIGAGTAWILHSRSRDGMNARPLAGLLVSGLLIIGVATLFTVVVPISLVINLQLFKTTVVVKLCAIVIMTLAADDLTRRWFSRAGLQTLWGKRLGVLVVAGVVISALTITVWNVPKHGLLWVERASGQDHDLSNVERWAATYAPLDATFAVPPSNSTFRSRAMRPIVVNYAAIPFGASDMREWYSRLQSIAPTGKPVTGIALKSQLDESFHNLSLEDWTRLAERYKIDYLLVRRSEQPITLPFEIAYQNDSWIVHRLRTDDESGA